LRVAGLRVRGLEVWLIGFWIKKLMKMTKNAFIGVLIAASIGAMSFVTQKSLSEKEKIEHLIKTLEQLRDAKFYRNGSYYSSKDAAAHLRMKWEKAGSRIKTAVDFIDKVATKSSVSGEEYRIIYSTGKEISSAKFLHNELKKLETKQ
jgi:hypothetical protein